MTYEIAIYLRVGQVSQVDLHFVSICIGITIVITNFQLKVQFC